VSDACMVSSAPIRAGSGAVAILQAMATK